MEGFLNLQWSRFKRVALTRSIAVIPTFIIAFYSDINSLTDMNDILNVLQSILLPFALIPILHFCALPSVMGQYRTGKFWAIAGPVLSLGVIGVNLFLTYDVIASFESTVLVVFSALFSILYFVFAAYLFWLYYKAVLRPQFAEMFLRKESSKSTGISNPVFQ